MAKKPSPSNRDRKIMAAAAPGPMLTAGNAAPDASAAIAAIAPPPEPAGAPEPDAGATEPGFGMTPPVATGLELSEAVPALVPAAAGSEVVADVVADVTAAVATGTAATMAAAAPSASVAPFAAWAALIATVPPLSAALAHAGDAYLHACLDWQREMTHFLDSQWAQGREAQRRLSACHDLDEVARVQRDWSAAAVKTCIDEAARLPVIGAKFWTTGLGPAAARAS